MYYWLFLKIFIYNYKNLWAPSIQHKLHFQVQHFAARCINVDLKKLKISILKIKKIEYN